MPIREKILAIEQYKFSAEMHSLEARREIFAHSFLKVYEQRIIDIKKINDNNIQRSLHACYGGYLATHGTCCARSNNDSQLSHTHIVNSDHANKINTPEVRSQESAPIIPIIQEGPEKKLRNPKENPQKPNTTKTLTPLENMSHTEIVLESICLYI